MTGSTSPAGTAPGALDASAATGARLIDGAAVARELRAEVARDTAALR